MVKPGMQLPGLLGVLKDLRYAAERAPAAAAREMALAVQHDHKEQRDPYGEPWAPVVEHRAREREIDPDITRAFDPRRSVRDSWQPIVDGQNAVILSEHRASAALQRAYKGRPRRLMHPIPGQGLGRWQKRLERMFRRLIHGAAMGEYRRQQTKLAAEWRRMVRFHGRNAERAKLGLKPLKRWSARADRRRIDQIVVRAVNGGIS